MKKQAQVVMLATDKAEDCLYLQNGKLHYHKGYLTQDYLKNSLNAKSYHLHIVSNDTIKSNNWCYNNTNLVQVNEEYLKTYLPILKKIVATTHSNLVKTDLGTCNICNIQQFYSKIHYTPCAYKLKCGEVIANKPLPQIPQQFIELFITEYNKGHIITEVEVEYEEYLDTTYSDHGAYKNKLLINKDNTINISLPVKNWLSNQQYGNTLKYWQDNAEEDYLKVPISVMKYITCLEEELNKAYTLLRK